MGDSKIGEPFPAYRDKSKLDGVIAWALKNWTIIVESVGGLGIIAVVLLAGR